MTEDIDVEEMLQALNLAVTEQVERRTHDWLVAARGADWTEKLESVLSENAQLRAELAEYAPVREFYGPAGLRAVSDILKERDEQVSEKMKAIGGYGLQISRLKSCTTHHEACQCIEATRREEIGLLKARVAKLEGALKEIASWCPTPKDPDACRIAECKVAREALKP